MQTLLSINNYYYRRGGAETIFLEHNRLFEAIGWSVIPFSMRHPKNLDTPWEKYFTDEIEFGAEYSWRERIFMAPKVIFSFEARKKLNYLLGDVSPDICHAHNIYHHLSPSILGILRRRNIPTILTLHDLKIACPAYTMLSHDGICERCRGGNLRHVIGNRCIKDSLPLSVLIYLESSLHHLLKTYERNVDRFIVPSLFYRNKFIEWGWSPDKFVHIPNFVDVDALGPAKNTGQAFIYFGRLGPEKGLGTLIKAVGAAGVKLLIAGTGPMRETLEKVAEDSRAEVTFLGYLSGDALYDSIRSARAMVLPSEWYENAPVSIMEAYALGKPVIGARIGGIPELIREGETGVIFTSGSVHELADALRHIAAMQNEEVARMGKNGREWMSAEFTPVQYRERLSHLYRDIRYSSTSGQIGN